MKTFKTPKGTELPLLNLKGKDYLQAQHRVLWFREEKPEWGIETEIISHSPDHTLARATIRNEAGRIMAQATKEETRQGFPDHCEKAETGSIARALALCGYGTQFAQEFEEGERLVDSPSPQANSAPRAEQMPQNPGDYIVQVGTHKGKAIKDIPELTGWVGFHSQNKALNGPMREAIEAAQAYLKIGK